MIVSTYNSSQRLSFAELLLPWKIVAKLMPNVSLLRQFTKREIEKRYKGTLLGLCWSFFTPLLMLAVYTVVFGFIFKGSYGHPGETKMQFVLGLFCGMLVWDLIAGSIASAPMLIVQNTNFVTKVIFPLEILPIAMVVATLVHTAIGFVPLLFLIMISQGMISWAALSLFFVFIPVVFYCLGLTWIISALGVFLRDIGAVMPAVITILMFTSAIFFPIVAIPEAWRWVAMLNSAAVLISMARDALVFGQWIDWKMYGVQLLLSLVVMMIGYGFFMKVKSAFADVL
ncbi:MAG: ABC transporter permease [Chthoniobacterales bacterium]|nr:ABC transporter permease [Chthoniobacterales bacterium]